MYRDYSAMSGKAKKGQPFKSSVKVTQTTTGAAQGTFPHNQYQYAQHVNAPPTNKRADDINVLGNSAVEEIDDQAEVTAKSEAVVWQNADQSVAMQKGPQVLERSDAQWNVDLCNRDSCSQVGNSEQLGYAVSAMRNSKDRNTEISVNRSTIDSDSANSQIRMVGDKGNQEGGTRGGEIKALGSVVERIEGDLWVEVVRFRGLQDGAKQCRKHLTLCESTGWDSTSRLGQLRKDLEAHGTLRGDVKQLAEDVRQHFDVIWVVRYFSLWTGVSSLLEYGKRIAWYEALHD